jgi:hypothetical protein
MAMADSRAAGAKPRIPLVIVGFPSDALAVTPILEGEGDLLELDSVAVDPVAVVEARVVEEAGEGE